MGCVSSVFQFGSYLVQEGAEVNEEQKEESTSEKDGVPVPSSPSQDTVVTVASSGSDKVQESPTKIEAPLAREEEAFTQQASPVTAEIEHETKQGGEAKAGDNQAAEPEVKELQRVNETKLEKEKTVDTSGATTEKTVYTQMSESVTIQETKGPAVDPFASQKTVFPPFSKSWHEFKPQATESQSSPSYVHSVKVTESSYSSPSSPVLVTETVLETAAPVPQNAEISVKSEVIEVATDVAESLSETHTGQQEVEKQEAKSPALSRDEQQAQVEQETPNIEADVIYEEEDGDDNERSDEVEDAVVKIQAGIRGYLTRKALKESRTDGPLMQSTNGGASVQPSKQNEVPLEETMVLNTEEMQTVTDSLIQEVGESDAAVKIQAMYRGYRTRKQLDELLNEPYDEEIETLNISAEQAESTVQESRKSPPDRSPVTVTENFVPILKAQVTITPPSSPTIKKEHSISVVSSVEVAHEDSKTSEIPVKSGGTDEEAPDTGMSDEDEDEEGKKQAATKIQAAFRGYKVRKTSRKETSGKGKEILEETEENMDLELGSDDNVDHDSGPHILRDTPSPPLDPENEEDTLEDDTADDSEEMPNVQWQTSELYTDDVPSPKHLHDEHVESKTESTTTDEEATAPVSDSPKTPQMPPQQVMISTTKISLGESHGSATPTTVEGQQMKSDH